MKTQMIVGRETEINRLNQLYTNRTADFLAVYGRRLSSFLDVLTFQHRHQ